MVLAKKYLLLLIFIIFGAFLRFYNLDWDKGQSFHPDERNIAAAVSRINLLAQMDPGFFAYGSFPIYLYRATGDLLRIVTDGENWNYDWGSINLVGRYLSALFSTLTIAGVYFLARKLFDEKIALLSSLLTAFSPTLIQTAHFSVTESLLTFAIIFVSFICIKIFDKPHKISLYVLCGIALGLALGSKTSASSFFIVPVVTLMLMLKQRKNLAKVVLNFVVLFVLSFLVFSLVDPFVYLKTKEFTDSMNYESGVVFGTLQVPYTLQFVGTTPYVFQLQNLFWQVGLILISCILGIAILTINAIKRRNFKVLIFLSFPLIYFAFVGSWHTKFIRYMVPFVPYLLIAGSFSLYWIKQKNIMLGKSLIIIFAFLTVLYTFAFMSIYVKPQTRIRASEWIYKNVPQNSIILGEHWDDGLPVVTAQGNPSLYTIAQLEIYNSDDEEKAKYYALNLSKADYIILNSRRLYGTLIRLEKEYPITSRYYKLLFAEKLGYKKIAEFTSYPSLLGLEINDDHSEETFQVYDHPKVIIFKNTQRLNEDRIEELIN